ncbi:alcohol dehydrogenase [Macrophomina phaseolina]|uniref:Alcohol dehydrogenase n=1 Tax=Macrophomina phaseolina TaxID=35725 RepID=A0ABQ8FPH2_9PEZI|nr:alcohol dehydrogenase [Macrophomina phaseolina]
MAIPDTYQAYRRTTGKPPLKIIKVTETTPKDLGVRDVLIRIHAVSLNYRDLATLTGRYPFPLEEGGIVASDCAAEVVAVGPAVNDFKIGDRVAPIFDLENLNGDNDETRGLGGEVAGVLRQFALFDEKHLVRLPENLSWEEASTIACAGVTAWNALNVPAHANRNKTALLQGTGGVSMFALLICLGAGIRPIITSSSDDKLRAVSKLAPEGSIGTINYRTHPDTAAEVKRLTEGRGVDIIVNNAGPSSLPLDFESIRRRGTISLVGGLSGLDSPDFNFFLSVIFKTAKVHGVAVGSKVDFQDLNDFIADKDVRIAPAIDRVFGFEDAEAAFQYLSSGKHVGKVVIKM